MLDYQPLDRIRVHPGLRIILVRGLPSPWGQAAKAMFEIKGLDYVASPLTAGGTNDEIVAWGGVNSAPIVAWSDEKPIHHWLDIVHLADRLKPAPRMIPADPAQRVLAIGLSHEICGEYGIGWNRRLQLFAPVLDQQAPNEGMARMSAKYRCNREDVACAGERIAASLRLLHQQLARQYDRGVRWFVGDALSAVDIYWTAFMNLLDPLPPEVCAIPEALRPGFSAKDPAVVAALSPLLVEHRDRIFREHFRSPMEL